MSGCATTLKAPSANSRASMLHRHHASSSSSSQILSSSTSPSSSSSWSLRKRKSSTTLLDVQCYADNPFLTALKHINVIDVHKSASSFAIKPYNIKFLCDILQCGFVVHPACDPQDEIHRPPLRESGQHLNLFKYKSMDAESKWNELHEHTQNERLKRKRPKPVTLNLSGNNLNCQHMAAMCKALLSRTQPINLGKFDLSINHNISDLCVRLLFKCIGEKCPKLQWIDLSYANITDTSCNIIYDFYYKYFISSFHEHDDHSVLLHKIDLSFTRISENGLVILDDLFNELPKSIKYIHDKKRDQSNTIRAKTKPKRSKSMASKIRNDTKRSSKKRQQQTLDIDASESTQEQKGDNIHDCIEQENSDQNVPIAATAAKIDPFKKLLMRPKAHKRSKSQSFEIVLKGCFFEPMQCKNYKCLASVPKLQTLCCIKADSTELPDFD